MPRICWLYKGNQVNGMGKYPFSPSTVRPHLSKKGIFHSYKMIFSKAKSFEHRSITQMADTQELIFKKMYSSLHKNIYWYFFYNSMYITSRFQIAIGVKTIMIGHVLNNIYDQLLSFLRYNCYLRVNCTVLFKLFTW